jgi:octaprenyl-diphosphate synthase
MADIEKVKHYIKDELKFFDGFFHAEMKTQVSLLNVIMQYLLRRKGKQMRPILVFLTAKLFGKPNESTYTAAALIEILHTATLIHDDVVDESNERRGFFSINAIWKSKISVLLGDFLLAKGLLLAIHKKEYEILDLVSNAVKEMSEGELMQIQKSRKLNISESEYFEIIRKKTATLISSCSACGAKSMKTPEEIVSKMRCFGELLGIAFQIKDDLLDYQINSLTGKPLGNDIQEKKLTLPLIHALEKADFSERKTILRIMNSSKNKSSQKVRILRDFIVNHEGLSYAEMKMKEYASRALNELNEFPNLEIREALTEFVNYTIERNK